MWAFNSIELTSMIWLRHLWGESQSQEQRPRSTWMATKSKFYKLFRNSYSSLTCIYLIIDVATSPFSAKASSSQCQFSWIRCQSLPSCRSENKSWQPNKKRAPITHFYLKRLPSVAMQSCKKWRLTICPRPRTNLLWQSTGRTIIYSRKKNLTWTCQKLNFSNAKDLGSTAKRLTKDRCRGSCINLRTS